MSLQPFQLGLGALSEPHELVGDEHGTVAGQPAQGDPQPPFPGDAEQQPLELDDPAQRRIATQLAIELEAAQPLATPRSSSLEPIDPNAERIHDRQERSPVLHDLLGEPGEERLGAGVPRLLPADRRDSSRPSVDPAK